MKTWMKAMPLFALAYVDFVVGAIASLTLVSLPARATGLPLAVSATVDYAHGTLTINGQNFGSSPIVTLGAMLFPTQSPAGTYRNSRTCRSGGSTWCSGAGGTCGSAPPPERSSIAHRRECASTRRLHYRSAG